MSEKFFAVRLRLARTAARVSQRELAERAGISLGALRDYEQGRYEPIYSRIAALAAALGVSPAELFPP